MRWVNSETYGALDLGADFTLGFLGLEVADRRKCFRPEVPGGIEEARNLVLGFHGPPPVCFPLAGQGQVQAQVGIGMCFRVGRDFGQPGARHDDARRSHRVLLQRVKAGGILGVRDGQIVGVNNQEL